MIEINLSTKGKEQDLTNIAGINFSLINVRYVVFGLILLFSIEPIIDVFYDSDINKINMKTQQITNENRKETAKLRQYDSVKEQVKELDEQSEKLKAKINIVKKIVEMRQNPFNVLKYIAENTPENVWLIDLEIDKQNLKLTGYSTSWKSIGDFIENLKSSIFFNGSVSYNKPESLKQEFDKKRVETFEISTKIVGF